MALNDDTRSTSNSSDSNTFMDYSISYEDEACDTTSLLHVGSIFIPIFFSIIVVLSLLGNILVILILVKYENLRSLTNTLILNLALSDLLFTAALPFWAYSFMHGWDLGETACKMVNFVFYMGFYSSGLLLIMMTAHRCVAVTSPLSDFVSTTGFYSFLASVLVWTVSISSASPAFVFTSVVDHRHCAYATSYWSLFGIYQQNILFIICSVVFTFCYAQIICRLLRPTARRRKSKTVKLIFTLMIVFFVGWTPYNIVMFLQSFHLWAPRSSDSEEVAAACDPLTQLEFALYVSRIFAFAHCCINPVFYVFVGVKFKNHLKNMLKSWGRNTSSIRSRQNRLTITSITSGEELSL